MNRRGGDATSREHSLEFTMQCGATRHTCNTVMGRCVAQRIRERSRCCMCIVAMTIQPAAGPITRRAGMREAATVALLSAFAAALWTCSHLCRNRHAVHVVRDAGDEPTTRTRRLRHERQQADGGRGNRTSMRRRKSEEQDGNAGRHLHRKSRRASGGSSWINT